MKIISKFKDYYDSGVAYGIDDTIHFIREESTIDVDNKMLKLLKPDRWTSLNGDYSGYRSNKKYGEHRLLYYKQSFVFFCGKLYPILDIAYIPKGGKDIDKVDKYIYGYDECLEFRKILQGKDKPWWSWRDEVELFKLIHSNLTDKVILDEHVKHQSAILYYNQLGTNGIWQVTINKVLKDIEFYKAVDTYSAFQEVSMFLGSTLCDVSTPKMPVGDDKVILKSKGFDEKYGFRTRPQK